jgi:hypothetical protein
MSISTVRLIVVSAIAAAVISGTAGAALASPAASPYPDPDAASCNGLVVAISNHSSGLPGASGNPDASAGPGYFLGESTPDAISEVRAYFC